MGAESGNSRSGRERAPIRIVLHAWTLESDRLQEVPMTTDTEAFLADVMPRWRAADLALHDGDPTPRFSLWSHADPVTLFGAARTAIGWADVEAVFELLGEEFSDCTHADIELVAAGPSGDLAYTVTYEHTSTSVRGEPRTYTLRSTQVYRREDDVWKVVHRHGDMPPDGAW
jgi:ketosteroid isomerase-like protein